jgi:short-subunit dehydrogenase
MEQQVALITGAGSGIGRALSSALARRGWAIAALDCRDEGLAALAGELDALKARHARAVIDVRSAVELPEAVYRLEQALGPTDLLIASAGVGAETSALDLRPADVSRVIDINLTGVANSVAAVLPGMLRRRRGHLVAMSSIASFRGVPRLLAYSASKAGLNAFMEGLRVEVRPLGLYVTTICPGWIRTPMTAALHDRLRDMLELEAAVEHILWAIDRRKAFYAFPRRAAWRLRVLRWLPYAWQDKVLARMSRGLQEKADKPAG